MTDLKPCPFCGADAVLFEVEPMWWYAQCTNEECKCRQASHSKEGVMKRWNRRYQS